METLGRVYHFSKDFDVIPSPFGNILLYQVGEICCEIGYEVPPHKQWCYEIAYIKSGEGTMCTDGVTHHVRTNDIYLNGKNDVHSIRADRGSQLRYLYMGFDVPEARRREPALAEVLRFFDQLKSPCAQDRSGVGDILGKTVQEFYWDQPCFEGIVSASLRLIIHLAYRNAVSHAASPGQRAVTTINVGVTVYLIIRYVDDHICEIGSIRDLAEKLGYSYTYISHLFKNKTGITLQQYIHKKKMEKAVELLTEAELTATQTAERLGYQSVQAFGKVFRGIYGMSPTQYLRQQRQEENA